MSDLPTFLIPFVIGVPLLSGLIGWIGGRWRVPRWFAAAGCGIGAGCAGASLVAGRFVEGMVWPTYGPLPWLTVGAPVSLGLRFDAFGLAWSTAVLVATTLLLLGPSAGVRTPRRLAMLQVLAATAVIAFVAATNLVQMLACGGVASLALFLAIGLADDRGVLAVVARRLLLHHLVGDGLFLLAILLAWERVGTLDVAEFAVGPGTAMHEYVHGDEESRGEHTGVVGLIGLALLGCVVARGALFPLFGSAHDAGRLPAPVAGMAMAIVAPCALTLLVRCGGPFVEAADVRGLALVAGSMTALLAGLSAGAQLELRTTFGLGTAAVLGVVLAGLSTAGLSPAATEGVAMGNAASLGAVVALLALVPCLAAVWSGLDGERWSPSGRWIAVVAGCVLLPGLFGLNTVVQEILANFTATETPYGVLLLLGLAATGFAFVRAGLRMDAREEADEGVIVVEPAVAAEPPFATPFVLLALAGAYGWLLSDGWFVERLAALFAVPPLAESVVEGPAGPGGAAPPTVLGLGLVTLAVLPGLVAGWMLRDVDPVPRLGVVGRLARQRFHLGGVLELGLVLPLRGIAQLCRFVDWFVLDGIVTGTPRRLLGAADALARPLRGAIVPIAVLSTALAVGGMLAAFVWW